MRNRSKLRRRERLLSDEEIRERMLSDPDTKARIEEILAHKRTQKDSPGITEEELSDFLREHG